MVTVVKPETRGCLATADYYYKSSLIVAVHLSSPEAIFVSLPGSFDCVFSSLQYNSVLLHLKSDEFRSSHF